MLIFLCMLSVLFRTTEKYVLRPENGGDLLVQERSVPTRKTTIRVSATYLFLFRRASVYVKQVTATLTLNLLLIPVHSAGYWLPGLIVRLLLVFISVY
jgi:hypothetical protein